MYKVWVFCYGELESDAEFADKDTSEEHAEAVVKELQTLPCTDWAVCIADISGEQGGVRLYARHKAAGDGVMP